VLLEPAAVAWGGAAALHVVRRGATSHCSNSPSVVARSDESLSHPRRIGEVDAFGDEGRRSASLARISSVSLGWSRAKLGERRGPKPALR